jgi:hypothetical protein
MTENLGPTPDGWEDGGICHVCALACHCDEQAMREQPIEHPCCCAAVALQALEIRRSVDQTIDLEKAYDVLDPTTRGDRIEVRFRDHYSNLVNSRRRRKGTA